MHAPGIRGDASEYRRFAPAWRGFRGAAGDLASALGIRIIRAFRTPKDSMTTSANVKRGVFPGQFDPITNGHLDVIRRGAKLFDELIIAVGVNPDKREMFTLDERVDMIRELLRDDPCTRVEKYSGLTAEFVRKCGATAILRGIRDVSDLRYEFQLALANRAVGGVETIFIMTGDQYALTSSSLIRQVVSLGGDVESLTAVLPPLVVRQLKAKQEEIRRRHPPEPDTPTG